MTSLITDAAPPDFMQRLSAATGKHGYRVISVLGLPNHGTNFSRLTATKTQLDASYGSVIAALGASGIALPSAYPSQPVQPLVDLAIGAGYTGGERNPNMTALGLVLPADLSVDKGIAAGVTFADAPGFVVIHVPSGIIAAGSGIWYLASHGTIDQTVDLLKQLVNATGRPFSLADVWVIMSPGARQGFLLNDKGRNKLANAGSLYAPYVTPVWPTLVRGEWKKYSLDLSAMIYGLWLAQEVDHLGTAKSRIPAGQISFDERNTLTERDETGKLVLPSKRNANERGELGYSSGLLALAIDTN